LGHKENKEINHITIVFNWTIKRLSSFFIAFFFFEMKKIKKAIKLDL